MAKLWLKPQAVSLRDTWHFGAQPLALTEPSRQRGAIWVPRAQPSGLLAISYIYKMLIADIYYTILYVYRISKSFQPPDGQSLKQDEILKDKIM